jgi:hypothetical protein
MKGYQKHPKVLIQTRTSNVISISWMVFWTLSRSVCEYTGLLISVSIWASDCDDHEKIKSFWGGARGQAVNRQFLVASARVRSQVRLCMMYGGRSGTRTRYLLVLLFPLPVFSRWETPWNLILLEKRIFAKLLKKFSTLYGTRKFIV